MAMYKVFVREIITSSEDVEADTRQEAIAKVNAMIVKNEYSHTNELSSGYEATNAVVIKR